MKVGVALTPYSPPTFTPIPTPRSIFTKAGKFLPVRPCVLSRAKLSKVGSIILHGPQFAEVKKATRTRCVLSSDEKDAGFVQICIGALKVEVAAMAGKEFEVKAGTG